MKFRSLIPVLLFALLAPATGHSANLPQIGETPFSADFSLTADAMQMDGTVNRTPGAERREMVLQGQRQVMLMRPAAGEVIMMLPEANLAMRLPLQGDPTVEAAEAFARANPEAVGSDTVDGEETTIYETSGDNAGRFWVTDDGIVMRSEVASEKGPVVIELSNVERGPQDPGLFEVPSGIQIMDADELPQMRQ
jgi:hypothetical protein